MSDVTPPDASAEARRLIGALEWQTKDKKAALLAYVAGLEAEVARLREATDAIWRNVIAYPFPQVCKHLVASNMLSDMERLGFVVTHDVADAVVNAHDEKALAHPPLAMTALANIGAEP